MPKPKSERTHFLYSQTPVVSTVSVGTGTTRVPGIKTPVDLGLLVRTYRKTAKLSQQELADIAGVGRRFLSELEQGKPTIAFGLVLKVTAALGIELVPRKR